MKRTLLVTFLILLSLSLNAQVDSLHTKPIVREPGFGVMLSAISTGWSGSDYRSEAGAKLGVFATRQLFKDGDLCIELHGQMHNSHRFVPHPYPNVIGMKETFNELRLRIPVSLLLFGDREVIEIYPYIAAGLYLDTPIYVRKTELRDYISNYYEVEKDVSSEFPKTALGMQLMMGFKHRAFSTEFRYSFDLTPFDLPLIDKKNINHHDFGLVVRLDLHNYFKMKP